MRALIIGGLAFLAWMLLGRWYYVCQIKGMCSEDNIETSITPPVEVEEGTLDLEDKEQFKYSEKEVLPELNEYNNFRIGSIVDQMKSDPGINLVIRGAYTENEKDVKPGFFENLGIARADAVRKMITDQGISEDRISLDFIKIDSEVDDIVRFEMTKKEREAAQYTFSNMSFSEITFDSESAVFRNPPRQFTAYADSLRTFLIQNPDKRITVTGHTDNEGDEDLNYKLGIRRGNSVEYYLRTKVGIQSPITVASKGETAPIADNSTPEGRRRNRRVQITIQ